MPSNLARYDWTPEDTAQEKARVQQADDRVAAWAHWKRSSGIHLDYPPESAFARVMRPADVEEQAGARHMAVDATDDEAMEIDAIVARLKHRHFRRFKILWAEFCEYGPACAKAKRHGMNRLMWRTKVDEILSFIADELGLP